MSAIGGSGGNGGDSNPLGMLQGILDPLGIIPGLSKMFQGGDAGAISSLGKSVLNNVGSFDSAKGGMSTDPMGDSTQGPPTEFKPGKDLNKAGEGYSLDKLDQPVTDATNRVANQGAAAQQTVNNTLNEVTQGPVKDTSGRMGSSQKMTAETQESTSQALSGEPQRPPGSDAATGENQAANQNLDPERAQSSSAATGVVQSAAQARAEQAKKNAHEIEVLTTVAANFRTFDTLDFVGGDGKFDAGNLRNLANNPNVPKRVQEAAQYLLAHDDLMEQLAIVSGGGNDQVTIGGVALYVAKLNEAQKNAPTNLGSTDKTGPDVKDAPKGNDGPKGKDGTDGTAGTHATGGTTSSGSKPASLDQKLGDMSGNLDALQDRLSELLDKESAAAKKDGVPMSEEDRKELATLPTKLLRATNRLSEMHTLVSNLMAAYHEMSMGSIGHIR